VCNVCNGHLVSLLFFLIRRQRNYYIRHLTAALFLF
jgi:hypothetical protein